MASYLDFNDLRNEGIAHLGLLTGKLWTDYNVHDPGITILEVLCYAMVDLDYRTKLPAADIFARNPATGATEDNFYSPAQILTVNPLTILDYRKLLSDLDGIRNAWLEVATETPYNGLYHIYIETEDDTDSDKLLNTVRTQLRVHRNLCEDIYDITILGKLALGVNAIIELNTDADPSQVYLDMMQALTNFLSPLPQFYTLQELLDKNKPIDAIFAGRPTDLNTSHGFADTDELENIRLKKELHLSDLYKALFEVTGIRTIRDLQWKPCNGKASSAWKFNIPKDHVIDFSAACCGIQFLRDGKPVPFDPSQFEAMLHNGPTRNIYNTPLPNLDLPFPKGNFRDDLANYYSIQNDFPNAYGIAKGGIPDDAPLARKAWARQLKGFLLFFDQLLADYLAQLANIRNLFSMGSPDSPSYPLNPLLNGNDPDGPNYVPDVDLLWKSSIDKDLKALLGIDGSTLVYPAKPTDLATPLEYDEWSDMQDVIIRLQTDFESGKTAIKIPTATPYTYYITTSTPNLVLVSKNTFTKKEDAQSHANYVLSNGMLDNTYSLFSIADDRFTFTLEYKITPVNEILQAEMEDPTLHAKRRQYFLDHLLSRFAEKFTDYALLQYGPDDPLKKAQDQIKAEEGYLSQYALLSSGRGQAANYADAQWNSANISGVEKKWMSLIGTGNGKRKSLCNFIVRKTEPEYSFSLTIAGKTLFRSDERFASEDAAQQAATALLAAMADRSNYTVQDGTIAIHYNDTHSATLVDQYPTEEVANAIADRLATIFARRSSPRDVFVSTAKTETEPARYKFHFYLGYEDGNRYAFDSVPDYDTNTAALDALNIVWAHLPNLKLQQDATGWTLLSDDTTVPASILTPAAPASDAPTAPPPISGDALNTLLKFLQSTAPTNPADYTTINADEKSQQGLYSWQLIDKDEQIAIEAASYADQPSAEQAKTTLTSLLKPGVKYLDIFIDGKIVRRRKDPTTGEYGFHYLIKCTNCHYSTGKPLILLESVKGYPTEDAATTAFRDGYLSLLEEAAAESSYGVLISLTEIISNDPPAGSPVVFVPKETKVSLGGADADVIKKMVIMAGSYPLKRAANDSNYIYYNKLSIPNPDGTLFQFQSIGNFATIAEAQRNFSILIRLLRCSGNLFTDLDDSGKYRIYIHEVLAESAGRFASEDDAWDAVEKFIAALHNEASILRYQINDCSNSFLVNNGPPILEHPCTYDSPSTRDKAKQLLISQFAKWNPKANTGYRENDLLILTNAQAEPFAKTKITDATKEDAFLITQLIKKIDNDDLTNIEPYQTPTPEDFNKQLHLFSNQYPIIRITDGHYSIELKLPDWVESSCYTSWNSTAAFTTGADAQKALDAVAALLADNANYLSVFTCDCRCFGIALCDPKDRVAIHPQAFTARQSVIAAVERTKKAVNAEGLHLVEHILLRPREGNENDNTCLSDIPSGDKTDCGFTFELPDAGPCDPVSTVHFIPGNDPLSFVATVVLPAWPEKFSQPDNRIVLENILYREAPAHVLLRILWLTPRDCCRFETQYKAWLKGIAGHAAGNTTFSGCDLIKILFNTPFQTTDLWTTSFAASSLNLPSITNNPTSISKTG